MTSILEYLLLFLTLKEWIKLNLRIRHEKSISRCVMKFLKLFKLSPNEYMKCSVRVFQTNRNFLLKIAKKLKYCPFSEMHFKSEWSRIILYIMLFKKKFIFSNTKIVIYNCTLFLFEINRGIGINIPSVIQFCYEFSSKIVTTINDFTDT